MPQTKRENARSVKGSAIAIGIAALVAAVAVVAAIVTDSEDVSPELGAGQQPVHPIEPSLGSHLQLRTPAIDLLRYNDLRRGERQYAKPDGVFARISSGGLVQFVIGSESGDIPIDSEELIAIATSSLTAYVTNAELMLDHAIQENQIPSGLVDSRAQAVREKERLQLTGRVMAVGDRWAVSDLTDPSRLPGWSRSSSSARTAAAALPSSKGSLTVSVAQIRSSAE